MFCSIYVCTYVVDMPGISQIHVQYRVSFALIKTIGPLSIETNFYFTACCPVDHRQIVRHRQIAWRRHLFPDLTMSCETFPLVSNDVNGAAGE